ncbi:MAG: hypothetical protein EPN82_06620 [Bacteroidetes bacterium]|nr:MAG: hypothetical protein EPN82_06620 [Bacteroidota bacterium]
MNYSRYVLMFLFLTVFVFSNAYAQEDVLRPHGKKATTEEADWSYKRNPIIIGVEAGLNINLFNQEIIWNVPDGYPHGTMWDGLKSASGISPHFGVMVDIPINKTFDFQLRAAYDIKNYGVNVDGTDIDKYGSEWPMNLKVDVASSYITLTPLLRINATDKLFFTVGPTFHFLAGDIETTWNPTSTNGITQLNDYPFWNNQFPVGATTGTIVENESPIQKSTRIGIEGGIGYIIPLSKSIFLVPQGRFQYMLTPVTSDIVVPFYDVQSGNIIGNETSANRMLHSLQLALALWFEI